MRRRRLSRRALVLGGIAASALLAACQSGAPPPEAPKPTTAAPTSAAPAAATPAAGAVKQELVVAAGLDQHTLQGPNADVGQYPLNENVYEPLVRMHDDYTLRPLLAERWELRGDTWRFYLRKGVKFHDGQTFNAASVKHTFDRLASSGNNTPRIGPDSTKIVDDYTVDVAPTVPNLRLPEQVLHPLHGMLAPGTDPATKPVGTGPFRFVEYRQGERFVVERNADYWGEKAGLERIVFRFMPDDNTRRLALEAGEADLALDLPREAVASLAAKPGLKVARAPVGANMLMYLNRNGGAPGFDLLKDASLRRAIGHAIDTKTLVAKVWEGNAEPGRLMAPASVLGQYAEQVKGFAFDPGKAQALLDEGGWKPGAGGVREKDGRKLQLTLIGWPQLDRATKQFVQAQLRDVGFDVALVDTPDNPSYGAPRDEGRHDINVEIPNQNDANPAFLPVLRFYSKAASKNAKYYAPGGRFDQLAEESLKTADRAEVQRLSAEMMKILIDEDADVIPLAGVYRIYGLRDRVDGFVPHPSQTNQLWDKIRLAK